MHSLLYLLYVGCSAGQSALGKKYARKGGNSGVFNLNKALAGLTVFLLIGLGVGLKFHGPTLLFGLGYGLFLSISNHTGFQALSMGPMALTSILASFSLVIPFVFGIAVWGEPLSGMGMIGILLLCISIVFLNLKKESGISKKWAKYAFLTMICNGICSLIQKEHQIEFPGQYRMEFLIVALLCVLAVTPILCRQQMRGEKFTMAPEGLISGVMNGAANYIVLRLAATENASVLFPVVSVANVIAVCLIGRVVFREKLKLLQILGIVLGILSIVLLNWNR